MYDSSIIRVDMVNPIHTLLGRWPNRKVAAEEIGAGLSSVNQWANRGRIPSTMQMQVVRAAQRRGFSDITSDWMLSTHEAAGGKVTEKDSLKSEQTVRETETK